MEKFLEGCEKLQDGRYRIRENMSIKIEKHNEPINEQIVVEGKTVKATRCYTFCIWDDNFNANGRNYKNVIDRVIKENRTTYTLINHPEDEADGNNLGGIAKNPRRKNGWLCIDWFPIGKGNNFADAYDLGAPAWVSSSVLGNLDNEGYVVNDDSFFLERYMDTLIVEPSNRVYHYSDHNEIHNDDNTFDMIDKNGYKESVITSNNTSIKEENTSIESEQNDKTIEDNENIGDIKMPENNDELLQASIEMNVKSLVKDAEKIESPFDKKDALISADSFAQKLTNKSLHDEICKKIEDVDAEIKALSDKGLQMDNLNAELDTVNNAKKDLEDEIIALKSEKEKIEEQLKIISEMYEEKQYNASETEMDKTHRLSKEVCSLKAKNRNKENQIIDLKNKLKMSESKLSKVIAEKNTKVDASVIVEMKDKIENLTKKNSILERKVNTLTSSLKESKNKVVEFEANANSKVDVEDVVSIKEKYNTLYSKYKNLQEKFNESEKRNSILERKSRFNDVRKTIESKKAIVENVETPSVVENAIDEDNVMEKMLSGNY